MTKQENHQPRVAGFPSDSRLRCTPEFQAVFRGRNSVADDMLIVYASVNAEGKRRLGLSVSRKVGNAVVRNRWKRFIRESFRTQQHDLPEGFDFVVVPRRGASPTAAAIIRSFPDVARRAARKAAKNKKS